MAVDFTGVVTVEPLAMGVLVNIVPAGADEKLAILPVDETGVKVIGPLETAATGAVDAIMVCFGGVDVTIVAWGVGGDLIRTLIFGFLADAASGCRKKYG